MLAKLLWTQETCNPMPSFEVSWNPVGPGLKYDPTVPDAPVLKEAEPMCKLYPEMAPSGDSEPGLWGPPE